MGKQDRIKPRTASDIQRKFDFKSYEEALVKYSAFIDDIDDIESKIAIVNAALATLNLDSTLSLTSSNPVINSTIKAAIDALDTRITALGG